MAGRSKRRSTAGAKRYGAVLAQVKEHLPDAARKGLEEVANKIVDTAKMLAPRDTGALAESVKWKWQKTTKEPRIKITTSDAKNKRGVPYGQYAEWDPRFSKAGSKPFLHPALDLHYDEVKSAVRNAVAEEIKKYGY